MRHSKRSVLLSSSMNSAAWAVNMIISALPGGRRAPAGLRDAPLSPWGGSVSSRPMCSPLTRQAPPMRHLASLRLLLLALAGAAWLSGCALAPGGHMDYRTETAPLDDLVDIEPITPGLVATYRNTVEDRKSTRLNSSHVRTS